MVDSPALSTLRRIFSTRMLICMTTGFASGMPLYVLIQLLPAWLRDSQVDLETIGLAALTGIPYTWKFLWSPLLDRISLPLLGRRRGWMLLTQLVLAGSIAAFALCDPTRDVAPILGLATLIAFASATQDIALDATRREILADEELGLGNSLFVNSYRISSLVPGSLALILADTLPWPQVHLVVAAFVLVGVLTTLLMQEPRTDVPPPRSMREAILDPFRAFFVTNGWRRALGILAFMLFYKLGDSMATALLTPFYQDLGFTLTEIGTVAKVAALWAAVGGGTVGGLLMLRIGINRALWLFGLVQIGSILGLAALSVVGHDLTWLFWVVSFEYLGVGLGTAAFVAFIARSTDPRYTATQLALLTSLTGIPRTLASSMSGYLINDFGYTGFYLLCTAVAVPGMLMLPWIAPWNEPQRHQSSGTPGAGPSP